MIHESSVNGLHLPVMDLQVVDKIQDASTATFCDVHDFSFHHVKSSIIIKNHVIRKIL